MEQEKTPLRKFIEQLEMIEKECGSHPSIDGSLSFYLDADNYEDIKDLEIVEVEPHRAIGCGCWYGASISFKIKENQ